MVDVGTGDGLYVYHSARQDPSKFFIGIDANSRPLEKISEKIYRRPAKGGLPNVVFVQSAVETLPDELRGTADEVHVNFPWGSLLQAVTVGDESVLRKLRQVCSADVLLNVVLGLDVDRDRTEIGRLDLPTLSAEYVSDVLAGKYRRAGFEIVEAKNLDEAELRELHTSWARRLQKSSNRIFMRLIARAE